jgi:hypothetical protein
MLPEKNYANFEADSIDDTTLQSLLRQSLKNPRIDGPETNARLDAKIAEYETELRVRGYKFVSDALGDDPFYDPLELLRVNDPNQAWLVITAYELGRAGISADSLTKNSYKKQDDDSVLYALEENVDAMTVIKGWDNHGVTFELLTREVDSSSPECPRNWTPLKEKFHDLDSVQ